PEFGGLKKGVGVVLVADDTHRLGHLAVSSRSSGWAAQVYVADGAQSALSDWGQPVATQDDVAGDATFDLHGRSGRAVLLWFTRLDESTETVEVSEVRLTS